MKQAILAVLLVLLVVAATAPALAQDPVKVDAKHYKVEFENDQVRVLRITYGPGEKSVMHEHPDAVATFLADAKGKFNMPDGTAQDFDNKKSTVLWTPAGKHLPENTGTKAFELILVEIKTPPMAAPAATKVP
jgi:quercetin dioxygenase-like cupin family protein